MTWSEMTSEKRMMVIAIASLSTLIVAGGIVAVVLAYRSGMLGTVLDKSDANIPPQSVDLSTLPEITVTPAEPGGAVETGVAVPADRLIDPSVNRLLTDEEMTQLNYPLAWSVRLQATRVSGTDRVIPVYTVESKGNDADGDGLSDSEESIIGTDPNKNDTDEDGLSDGYEKSLGLNPLQKDSDGDGVMDGAKK